MAKLLRMPEVAANVVEAVLQEWAVPDNMPFAAQDAIATVETDKAVVEVAAPEAGVILKQLVPAGESVAVGAPIAVLGEPGEQVADLAELLVELGVAEGAAAAKNGDADQGPVAAPADNVPAPGNVPGTRQFASPLARRLAKEADLAIEEIAGTGPGGRVVRRDIEAALARRASAPAEPAERSGVGVAAGAEPEVAGAAQADAGLGAVGVGSADAELGAVGAGPMAAGLGAVGAGPMAAGSGAAGARPAAAGSGAAGVGPGGSDAAASGGVESAGPAAVSAGLARPRGYTDIPHSRVRRAIAARLGESVRTAPHFYLRATIRVDKLLKLRARLTNVTINDLLLKAAAHAHVAVPAMNVIWTPDAVRAFEGVDIAVAVATDQGLVTPVVRDVDRRAISDLAAGTRDLAARARQGRLKQHEIDGGTLTVSNLGKYGTEEFAAIINPPHAAILAIGAARREPIAKKGRPAVATVIRCTLSVDHRPVDGVTAAQWLDHFVDTVEHPLRILS